MFQISTRAFALGLAGALALVASGCTSARDYVHNGFKVGPEYAPPCGPVAEHWIDAADARVHSQTEDISHWWTVFNDDTLNNLVLTAYRQNLTLREAGSRILEARATLGIAEGNFWPQAQTADGSYTRGRTSGGPGFSGSSFSSWNFGFNMAWELDFWGRFRRAIESNQDLLEASVADYDDVLVTLIGDVATNYITIRTDQERIRLLKENVEVQRVVWELGKRRLLQGAINELNVQQAEANLKQTMAQIPLTEIDARLASNRLCVLLGIPPKDLGPLLGEGPIPYTPSDVVVGIPADLLRRRPDVRRAERTAAAQMEQIGIAESQWYPAFSVTGNLGWQAATFSGLFKSNAFNGNVGPQFNWDILNYGRILNNVRLQNAHFQELVSTFQQTVLQADADVENGIVDFLKSQEREKDLGESVQAGRTARDITLQLYEKGEKGFDFNQYALIEQNLISQQDSWVQARGQIALGLIEVYRGLGGGWQIRCEAGAGCGGAPPKEAPTVPAIPTVPTNPPAEITPALPAAPAAPPVPGAQSQPNSSPLPPQGSLREEVPVPMQSAPMQPGPTQPAPMSAPPLPPPPPTTSAMRTTYAPTAVPMSAVPFTIAPRPSGPMLPQRAPSADSSAAEFAPLTLDPLPPPRQ